MNIDRRHAIAAAGSVLLNATVMRLALSQPSPLLASRSREVQTLFSDAARIGLDKPRAAGTVSALDLAELVDDALALGPANDNAGIIANRAGLLLSELTRDERDGLAIEEPAPAAPRTMTPVMEQEYRDLFASARVRDTARVELTKVARFITSDRAKQRYKEVEADTKVPWFVVGAIHYREANLNFLGHLHNGDPLMLRTVHVPENRPPAPWPKPDLTPQKLWRESARDALRRFEIATAWTLPSICFFMEGYNGFGCRDNGIHSPYLWNYTQYYTRGGFPRDHFFSADYVSKQAGLMSVLVAIRELSPTEIVFAP
jgi:lysozyme family protein